MKIMIWFHAVGAICSIIPSYFMWPEYIGFSTMMLISFGINLVAVIHYSREEKRINRQNRNAQIFRQKDLTEDAKKTFNPPK